MHDFNSCSEINHFNFCLFAEFKFSIIKCHTSAFGAITTDTKILTFAEGKILIQISIYYRNIHSTCHCD